jgi:hypothetical protein
MRRKAMRSPFKMSGCDASFNQAALHTELPERRILANRVEP